MATFTPPNPAPLPLLQALMKAATETHLPVNAQKGLSFGLDDEHDAEEPLHVPSPPVRTSGSSRPKPPVIPKMAPLTSKGTGGGWGRSTSVRKGAPGVGAVTPSGISPARTGTSLDRSSQPGPLPKDHLLTAQPAAKSYPAKLSSYSPYTRPHFVEKEMKYSGESSSAFSFFAAFRNIIFVWHGSVFPKIWIELLLAGSMGVLAGSMVKGGYFFPDDAHCGTWCIEESRFSGIQTVGVLLAFMYAKNNPYQLMPTCNMGQFFFHSHSGGDSQTVPVVNLFRSVFRSQISFGLYKEGRDLLGILNSTIRAHASTVLASCAAASLLPAEGSTASKVDADELALLASDSVRLLKLFYFSVTEHVRSTNGHRAWVTVTRNVRPVRACLFFRLIATLGLRTRNGRCLGHGTRGAGVACRVWPSPEKGQTPNSVMLFHALAGLTFLNSRRAKTSSQAAEVSSCPTARVPAWTPASSGVATSPSRKQRNPRADP